MSKKSDKPTKKKKKSKKQLAAIDQASAQRAEAIENARAKLARALVEVDVARAKVSRRERELVTLMADEEVTDES